MADRLPLKFIVSHGETVSFWHIVDPNAPEPDQPCVLLTCRTSADAAVKKHALEEAWIDPDATWAALLRSYRLDDDVACRQCCRELLDWLLKEGRPPSIVNVQGLDSVMVHAVCTAYLSS